jgi:hypothetical protein
MLTPALLPTAALFADRSRTSSPAVRVCSCVSVSVARRSSIRIARPPSARRMLRWLLRPLLTAPLPVAMPAGRVRAADYRGTRAAALAIAMRLRPRPSSWAAGDVGRPIACAVVLADRLSSAVPLLMSVFCAMKFARQIAPCRAAVRTEYGTDLSAAKIKPPNSRVSRAARPQICVTCTLFSHDEVCVWRRRSQTAIWQQSDRSRRL